MTKYFDRDSAAPCDVRLWLGIVTLGMTLLFTSVARADVSGLSYLWKLGTPADLDPKAPAHFTDSSRVGKAGTDGDIAYREMLPKVYQCPWVMPAFDFDPKLYGAANHSFYLTIHFKDVAKRPIVVYSTKEGAGFEGSGYCFHFGGAGDGQWKDVTIIIRRSLLRTLNGKQYQFMLRDVSAPVPVSSMLLFSSAATDIPDIAERIKQAEQHETETRQSYVNFLKRTFKEVPLPAPDAAPPVTAQETAAGYRIFFPPGARQLFGNSQPTAAELTAMPAWFAVPDQTETATVAVRALKDVGAVSLKLSDLHGVDNLKLQDVAIRWAQYRDYRVGSSWATTYRVQPNILLDVPSQNATPDRLEICDITFHVPPTAKPGDYHGTLTVTAEHGATKEIPVSLHVYPFALEHPDHATHSMFYYVNYGRFDPLELLDMRAHGIDGLVTGLTPQPVMGPKGEFLSSDEIRNAYHLLAQLGFKSPTICITGNLSSLTRVHDSHNEHTYGAIIKDAMQLAEDEGFKDTAFFPVDEPHSPNLIALSKLTCTWTKQVPGARTYITSNPTAVAALEPVLDDVGYNLAYMTPKNIDRVHEVHETLMYYAGCTDIGPENGRFRAGFYLNRSGAENVEFFAYDEASDDPFNDLDGGNRDWTSVFPSMTSPFPDSTLSWEEFREGVNDYKYAYTLQELAKRAAAAGHQAAADKAMKVYNDVMADVNIDATKSNGPEMAIEADTSLKNRKIDPGLLAQKRNIMRAGWYDQSRQKIADAIVELQTETKMTSDPEKN